MISKHRLHSKLYSIFLFFLIQFSVCSQAVSDKAFVQNYIDTMESKIEISCSDLYSDAILFLNQEISKLIKSGRSGEDWVALFYKDLQKDVSKFKEKLFICWICKSNAERVGIEMEGYYKELYELFGMLDTFLTGWGDKPPSSKGLSLWDLGSDQVNSLKYD